MKAETPNPQGIPHPADKSQPGAAPASAPGAGAPEGGSAACQPGLKALFLGFSKVGLSGFGGVLPFARRMLVEERGWLSAEEFNTLLGLCQFLPGPNVVNLAVVVGSRYRGLMGALVAPAGLMAGPFAIVLLLALLYDRYGSLPAGQGLLRGIAAVGAGLLFATAIRMALAIKARHIFWPFTALVIVTVAGLRWSMPAVMLGGLLLTSGIAWWRLKADDGAGR